MCLIQLIQSFFCGFYVNRSKKCTDREECEIKRWFMQDEINGSRVPVHYCIERKKWNIWMREGKLLKGCSYRQERSDAYVKGMALDWGMERSFSRNRREDEVISSVERNLWMWW